MSVKVITTRFDFNIYVKFILNRFITNIWALNTDSWSCDLGRVPVLWLNDENDDTYERYRLVVYKAHNSIICMFIKSKLLNLDILLFNLKSILFLWLINFFIKMTDFSG